MRRTFDHFHAELSVAAGHAVPRYPLWLALADAGWDPEGLDGVDVLAFCDGPLDDFLRAHGLFLRPRRRGDLLRRIARFDPRHPTPAERFAAPTD